MKMRLHWEFFAFPTLPTKATSKNNAVIIMFKASDVNETNVNDGKRDRERKKTWPK